MPTSECGGKYSSNNGQEMCIVQNGDLESGENGIIWKYSNIMNEWTKWMTTDLFSTSCFDDKTQTILELWTD